VRVLVTGGAGYIGSHAVRALSRAGHQVAVLDNPVYGHRDIVRDVLNVPLVEGQVGDRALLDAVLAGAHPALAASPLEGRPIEAVLHFAAYAPRRYPHPARSPGGPGTPCRRIRCRCRAG